MYQTIFFDLDGTLTDSGPGITHSVAYALNKWNIKVEDYSVLNAFVGPPLAESFAKYYNFTPEQCQKSIEYYREYYVEKGMFENSVYPGIRELGGVSERRRTEAGRCYFQAGRVCGSDYGTFRAGTVFRSDCGSQYGRNRVEKADVLRYAIEAGSYDLSGAVMVGDRENDVRGARENGLPCIGVLYGYGSREELTEAGAARIAATVEELKKCLDK